MAFSRSVATVGFFTLLSRLLGFVRDLVTANLLGVGPVADAYIVAQRLPNMFRALFAEGAVDSTFVPIYTRKKRQEAPAEVAVFVNHIFTILVLVLLPLTILAILLMPWVIRLIAPGFADDPQRFNLAVTYGSITFGYLLLVSVTALQGGLLNANRHFAPFAIAPVILNAIMIAGLLYAKWEGLEAGLIGSWALIAGGVAQCAWLYVYCRRQGLSLGFAWPRWTSDVRRFFKLVGPGVIGISADQIHLLVSTILASTLPSGAIAALYYADRVNQLPFGVIGGAIATTLLPVLTHHIAARETKETTHHFSRAIEIALLVSLPVGLVLLLAAEPLIRILFQHGAFDAENTRSTAQALASYALAIPAYMMVRILNMRFFAHEDTKTPVLVTFIAVLANGGAAWLLKPSLGHVGIALAFTFALWVNAVCLSFLLWQRGQFRVDRTLKRHLPRLAGAAAIMGGVLMVSVRLNESLSEVLVLPDFIYDLVVLGIRLGVSGMAYLAVLDMLGVARLSDIKKLLKRA
ncbi:MAG: murein biosynthesis integral membrane protein MurJ [Alphaproteobacteria bacterium]|nr:murein biosynthesis integral membrane protein MurJ [Alphaproteobacteria bacterium]